MTEKAQRPENTGLTKWEDYANDLESERDELLAEVERLRKQNDELAQMVRDYRSGDHEKQRREALGASRRQTSRAEQVAEDFRLALEQVKNYGYNDNCLFCGFKDRVVMDALAKHPKQFKLLTGPVEIEQEDTE